MRKLILALTLLSACGPKFTSSMFTDVSHEQSAGEAGQEEIGNAGEGGETETIGGSYGEDAGKGGTAGSDSPLSAGGNSGQAPTGDTSGASSGGTVAIAGSGSSGTGGNVQEQPSCLAHFETDDCALVCTQAPVNERACVQLLECMRTKNTHPAQTSLDPCYGTGYEDLTRATLAYNLCCN